MASRYGTFAIQFLTSIWLAVKLGPYYFGLWSFILLLVNIGSQCNWGIANAVTILLVQHKEDRFKCDAFEFMALIMTAIICLLPVLIAVYDTLFPIPLFAKYHLGRFSYAVAFIVACFYLNQFFINVLRVKNRLLEIAINQSLFPVLTFILIFFATDRQLLTLLVFAYVAAMVISIGLFLRTRLVSFSGHFSFSVSRQIMGKGFYLFLYNACFYLIMLTTKMIVSAYYSVESFGHFAFAFNVANATLLLIDSLMFLLFPKMIDVLRGPDAEAIRTKLTTARICYITTMVLLFAGMMLAFGALIRFVPKYTDSFPIFIGIATAMLVYMFCFGYNIYMLAQNHERRMAIYSMLGLVGNVLGVWILAAIVRVPVAFCLGGTVAAYLLYITLVNGFARRRLAITAFFPQKSDFLAALGIARKLLRSSQVMSL